MSLGCVSVDRAISSSCLSEFAGKYADRMCEFCCTSHDYCNALKSFETRQEPPAPLQCLESVTVVMKEQRWEGERRQGEERGG